MPTIAEQAQKQGHEIFQEWRQALGREPNLGDSLKRGLELGRNEGKAYVLTRLLVLMFGPMELEPFKRIQTASTEQLNDWVEALLHARSLEQFFASTVKASNESRGVRLFWDTVEWCTVEGYEASAADANEETGEEGRVRGKAELLRKLLRLKFGRLPAGVRKQVNAASADELDAWAEALLAGPSLDEIFACQPKR